MSLWVDTKRIARAGAVGFLRNGFVTLATVLIMSITLFVIGSILVTGAALESVLTQLQQKVDINVYFLTDASEEDILDLRDAVEERPEVAAVEYISREEALEQFRERHRDDQLTIQALDELAENPLGASLAIQAKQPNQYEAIANFLQEEASVGSGDPIIEKINFFQNRAAIERLSDIITASERFGLITMIFLIVASTLIVFNTIRLAIYTTKDEINVMQLVGASDSYVQGPFIIEGALYGLVGALVALFTMYPLALWLGPASEQFLGSFNVLTYYTSHFALLFLVLVGTGVVLGAFSSFLAVRRYLNL